MAEKHEPPLHPPTHSQTRPPQHEIASPYAAVADLYQVYRILRLNVLYYGQKLRRLQQWNMAFEVTIALSTSATVAAVLKKNDDAKWVLGVFAALSAVLGVLKPIVGLAKRIERSAKLRASYQTLFSSVERLVRDLQVYRELTPQFERAVVDVRDRMATLSADDDPFPDGKTVQALQDKVNKEIPVGPLWAPADGQVT